VTGTASTKSPSNAVRRPHESTAAVRRWPPRKPRSAAGTRTLEGLCLALADWSAELRLLRGSLRFGHRCATFGPRSYTRRRLGMVGQSRRDGPIMQESRPEAGKPATAVPGGPGRKEVFDAIR
jgi:hypothetical protein